MSTAVLLPGNMCDARLWRGEPSLAANLMACGHSVVEADLTLDNSIPAMATRALEARDGPLIAIGFSMGAIVALAMARQAPARIAALVLLALNAAADLPDRAAARPGQQARAAAGELEAMVGEELKPRYFAPGNLADPALREPVLAMARALGPAVFARQSEALRTRTDLRPVLPTLACPLFLGVGLHDALCPPEWHLGWQRLAPHARLTIFEGAGHMLPLEAPRALAAALAPWITEMGL